MNTADRVASPGTSPPIMPNGSGGAAILSAGVGCFALAVLSIAADKSAVVKDTLIFYKPTGALSGVTTVAILIWLLTWGISEWRWRRRSVAIGRVNLAALVLLALSLLLTFPSIVDLF